MSVEHEALTETLDDFWAKPWTANAEQDKAVLAGLIEDRFVLVRRADLPEAQLVDTSVHVDGADSVFPLTMNVENLRRWAREYLAAAEGIEQERGRAERLRRRDRIAGELRAAVGVPYGSYEGSIAIVRAAVDRIIELEDRAAE